MEAFRVSDSHPQPQTLRDAHAVPELAAHVSLGSYSPPQGKQAPAACLEQGLRPGGITQREKSHTHRFGGQGVATRGSKVYVPRTGGTGCTSLLTARVGFP